MNLPRVALWCGVLAFAAAAPAQTPGFWLVGLPAGASSSGVSGLSQDGSVAVGGSQINNLSPGFRWTAAGGREDFGLAPGMPGATPAQAISRDGSTIVGYMSTASGRWAYRRVGAGSLENLGPLGSYWESYAHGVSGDGSVVVGQGVTPNYPQGIFIGQAFRWSQQTGMQGLGVLPGSVGPPWSVATGISRDGSTIVGVSGYYLNRPFVWRESTGIQALPSLPGSVNSEGVASAASSDGSMLAGWATGSDGQRRMVRWTAGGVENLGFGEALAMSDDGSVLGGYGRVWTAASGSMPLIDFLALHGVQVPAGWTLPYLSAISGDGLTFAGSARSPAGIAEGFVATIPSPSGIAALLVPALYCSRRRRAVS